ncbi:unnamed protein product [Phytophthora fragariaefolia]|uniref:Unnamed protein product n=1 Tax=Phytophthora fragariaefolia TaxID=1490495 RepID=A0A9W6WUJ3_9STRA|nr:unnamed protein product [Phytophthora fragariaefolia]
MHLIRFYYVDDDITGDWEVQSDNEQYYDGDGSQNDEFSDDDMMLELPLDRGSYDASRPMPVRAPSPDRPAVIPTSATLDENACLASIQQERGLHLAMDTRVRKAYEKHGSYGLFSLFVTATLRESIRGWTSTKLEAAGKKALTESELNAYVGLEIAMSLCPLSDIADFWSTDRFLG